MVENKLLSIMTVTKMSNSFKPAIHALTNLKKMLIFAWQMDRKAVLGYYATAVFSSLGYISVSVLLKFLIDALVKNQTLDKSAAIPLAIAVLLASRYVLNHISNLLYWSLNQTYFDYTLRYKLQNTISYQFYKKLAVLDMAQLEDPKTQDLIVKTRDTMLWRLPGLLQSFSYFVKSLVFVVSSFIVLLGFGWQIPLIISLSVTPLLVLKSKYADLEWSLYGSGAPEVKKLWYFGYLLSNQTAIKEMRIFKSSEELLKKYKKIQQYLYALNKKPIDMYLKYLTLPPVFQNLILFLIAFLQLPAVLSGRLTIGGFTLLINLADGLLGEAESVVYNFGAMYSHSLFVDHYFEVLSLFKKIEEPAKPFIFKNIEPPLIEFKNISFSYPNGAKVLSNISFTVSPGENVALVGENGAGKSTIIKLLCRFYDVGEGEILINGVNLKELRLVQWYQFLGTLFQDFVQYHFTVRENIALGSPGKNSETEIIDAAKKSGAWDFIEKLPKGLDTMLGREFEDGEELSIGQWQKLAIARAFYESAPVLILDEPTSAIDAEAEYEIFNNLEKTYKNKTLILVSHRFSTVRNADKIMVVEHGRITESGSHEELLKLNGKYARMFTTQAKGYQ